MLTSTGHIDYVALIKLIALIIGIFGGLSGLAMAFFTKFIPWRRTKKDQRSLEKRFGAELYPRGVIDNSTQYYIEPDCQSLDPSGSEEPRLTLSTKENLFKIVDDYLTHPTDYRYLILLADSGMGKTSFFLNYYARHLRKKQKFKLALLPLGIPDVDKRIQELGDKKNTALFLDAFDEDTLAIVDHAERLRILLNLTREFQKVLITCRTQFFPKDEEIPRETGIVKIGPRRAGEGGEYVFHKLYLKPFSNEQVDKYLKHRYSFWQRKQRKKAKEMVKKIPDLSARPMLLAYIDDLVRSEREVTHTWQLYEEMVEAWLIREQGIIEGTHNKKEHIRHFSEQLAVDLYVKRKHRGAERVPGDELKPLAQQWNIPLEAWQLKGRSLLNRDAVGNYKFAHRSIMEYLFVKRLVEGDERCKG